jgi:hypothetical protein
MGVNWVSHFLKRHQDKVLPIWTTGMDYVWPKADTEGFYSNYFIVLNHKLDCKIRPLLASVSTLWFTRTS